MTKTLTQPGGSLTEAQRRQYDEAGYIVLPELITLEELQPIKDSLSEKVETIAAELLEKGLIDDTYPDAPFETRLGLLFSELSDREFNSFGRSWRERRPGFYDLMSNRKILDAVESLIGPEIFANPVYNVRPKVPKVAVGAVPWHQDKCYWPDANSNPVITVWIPLVDADEENGCLRICPGTHRERVLSFHAEQRTGTEYTETDGERVEEAVRRNGVVVVPVKAGSAILFNDRALHMSTVNRSPDRIRWSVDLRYQPTDQDPMLSHGVGFLARSRVHPERVATREDWMAEQPEHQA